MIMRKLVLLLCLLFLSDFIYAQKTIKVYNQTYIVNGDLTSSAEIGDPGHEKEPKPWVDCYVNLSNHQLVYARVSSVNKIVTLLETFEVDITLLDLKNASIDWEPEHLSNPMLHCIMLKALDNKDVIEYDQYDGKGVPISYRVNKLNIDYSDEKKAKDYLKELKAAAKK